MKESKNLLEIPCDECIHNRVCNVKKCFKETKVETTHPYIRVKLECREFHQKPINDFLNR